MIYYIKLQNEYEFLQNKYSLKPMSGEEWKLLRLRPANFPSLRIAQLAMLIHQTHGLFSKLIKEEKMADYRRLFDYGTTEYWRTHYLFGKKSKKDSKRNIGKTLQDILIINTIVPILFAYAKYVGQEELKDKALRLLQEMRGEENYITEGFRQLGIPIRVAYDSQAVIQLKQKYCDFKRCEQCAIGHEILKQHYR